MSPALILLVGKSSVGKGALYALGALHRVVRERPDVQLVMLGKGGDSVRVTRPWLSRGHVPHDAMAAWYSCASLVVHASLMEGAPRAVREAKAAGCYVIATDVGGTRECAPDVLVPPRDPVALAEAILEGLKGEG